MASFSPVVRDAGTVQTGLRDPASTLTARVRVDMQDEMMWWMPNSSFVVTFTTRLRNVRTVSNPRFDSLEVDQYPRVLTVSGAQTSGDVSIELVAGQGDRIRANDVLMNITTREQVLVSSVATDTATVVRAIGSTAQAMSDGDRLLITRGVYEDGSDSGTLKSVAEASKYNYCEIIRRPFGWTRRQANLGVYGGNDVMIERKKQGIEHKKDLEYSAYFGRRHSRTGTGGKQQSFTGGAEYFIESNVWDLNGQIPSQRAFEEYLEEVMRWGEGGFLQSGLATKYLIASSRWISTINNWASDKVEYKPLDKVIGFSAMEYLTPFGRLMMAHSPILDEEHQDWAFIFDFNHIRRVNYDDGNGAAGRTGLRKNIEDPGVDGTIEEYLSDVGWQFDLEQSHGILKGLPT